MQHTNKQYQFDKTGGGTTVSLFSEHQQEQL